MGARLLSRALARAVGAVGLWGRQLAACRLSELVKTLSMPMKCDIYL